MKSVVRVALSILAVLALVLFILPLIVPVPPLTGTLPPQQLADPDSLFVQVDGLMVHYKMQGQGQPVFVLLHGFGSSTFSWRDVMGPMAQYGTVIAFDRPAFGLTERPLPGEWVGENPYTSDAQVDLTLHLMDRLGVDKAILVGNSAGGTIAVSTALRQPERVEGLILVSPAIYDTGGGPSWIKFAGQVRRSVLGANAGMRIVKETVT